VVIASNNRMNAKPAYNLFAIVIFLLPQNCRGLYLVECLYRIAERKDQKERIKSDEINRF